MLDAVFGSYNTSPPRALLLNIVFYGSDVIYGKNMSSGIIFFLFFKLRKIQQPFSRGGAKKRKSNNDDKHDHGLEKRRPSTYVEGKHIYIYIYVYMSAQARVPPPPL